MRQITRLSSYVISLVLLATASCRQPPVPPATEVVLSSAAAVPAHPADPAWQKAPEYVASLILQDLVEPRQLAPTTAGVRVRAITNGAEAAFRLEWDDGTESDLPRAARFTDACAIQLPSRTEPNVPAPQMGEPGKPVEITYWSAAWQANVDGRGDTIKDLYPNASVDHYPFQAQPLEKDSATQQAMTARYSPARAVGNFVAGPHTSSVQDLIAEGPGTLSPAPTSRSTGKGVRTATGWAVVIVRPVPQGLVAPARSQIAFAVWEGSQHEVGARKMRTGWIPLASQGKP